jgi:hypothetical protein
MSMFRCLLVMVALLAASRSAIGMCIGDCNGDGEVTVDELLTGVNVALGAAPLSRCPVLDANADGEITVDELLRAVGVALEGCGSMTPTPSPTPIATGPVGERASLFFRCPTFNDGSVGFCHFITSRNAVFQPLALPQSVQLSNMFVYCDFAVGTGSQTLTLHINGADTSLGCTVGTGEQVCQDTDPTHVVAYTSDQDISVKVSGPSGSSAPVCRVSMTARVDANTEADAIFTWNNNGSDYTPFQDHYCGPGVGFSTDPSECGVTTADDASWAVGSAGRVSGFTVRSNIKLTGGTSETFTVCKLGVGSGACDSAENGLTGLEVTIDDAIQKQTDTTCTQNCDLNPGDRLAVKVSKVVGSPGPKKWHFAVTVDGVPAHLAFKGPRSTGERYYNMMITWPSEGPTLYRIDRPGTLRNLYCYAGSPPTVSTTFSVCVGSTDTAACGAMACTMDPTGASCSDTTRAVPVAAGDYVGFRISRSGGDGWHGCSLEVAP